MQGLDFVAGHLDEYIVEVLAGKALLDLVSSAGREHFSAMQKEDAVADLLDVAYVVLRVQNLQNLAEWFCGAGGEVSRGAGDAW